MGRLRSLDYKGCSIGAASGRPHRLLRNLTRFRSTVRFLRPHFGSIAGPYVGATSRAGQGLFGAER